MSQFRGRPVLLDWRTITNRDEKYQAYLASREWAVLKEAVKARSGGTCEYCLRARGTQTHHMTYIRKYRELLSDLLHVCEPCHLYLSDKSDFDPRSVRLPFVYYDSVRIEDVYLAGKISCTTWRDQIVPGWSRSMGVDPEETGGEWVKAAEAILVGDYAVLNMTGPFWVDLNYGHGTACDNTGVHANGEFCQHGTEITPFGTVRDRIEDAISRSDLVFAWVDSREIYGTLAEIGFARGAGIPVVIASPPEFEYEESNGELWLAYEMSRWGVLADTPGEAWKILADKRFDRGPSR